LTVNLWTEKYEPIDWNDWLGNEDIKNNFQHKSSNEIINNIFAGPPGTGKSLCAKIISNQHFGRNILRINASEIGIDAVKGMIKDYCKGGTVDMAKRKVLLLEEFDGITKAGQKALRVPMEKYAKYIVFIGTCNYPEKIIDAIHSRACTIRFKLASYKDLKTFLYRIVEGEGLTITGNQSDDIIRDARGKFRNVANLLQGWTTGKKVMYKSKDDLYKMIDKIFNRMKKLDNDGMLKEIENALAEYDSTMIMIRLGETIKDSSMPTVLKSSCLIACGDCMEQIVIGVDIYLAFWSLCSKLTLVYRRLTSAKK
jgi:DNA polymerase III delta prime subunit